MNLTGTILVANSDRITTEFFDIILSKLKFDVIKAFDGIDVLKKVKKHSIDLILIENDLPKINGINITKKIRKSGEFKNNKNIPIIIFSSKDSPEEKVLGFESGADDFISKPYNFSEVIARIRTVLRHKILMQQIVNRERRLAILESVNTNLISFTKHIKKPLSLLYKNIKKTDFNNKNNVKSFLKKFENNYKEMVAMLTGLEEEIKEFKSSKNLSSADEFCIKDLEKKIDKHLKLSK